MKVLSRDFSLKEKILLALLAIILIGLGYYYFIDQPVRRELANSAAEKVALQTELATLQQKQASLKKMQSELDAIMARDDVSRMSSYNASKEEIKLLNDVLSQTSQYSVSFANVSRDGDQIRRNFSLQFVAPNYATMAQIISDLAKSTQRCVVSNIACSHKGYYLEGGYTVSATATFYETMVGGTPDAGLPG